MAVNTFYLKTTGASFVNVMSCYSQVGFEKTKIKLTGVMCLSVVIILLRTVHKSGPTILMQGDMTELLLFTTVWAWVSCREEEKKHSGFRYSSGWMGVQCLQAYSVMSLFNTGCSTLVTPLVVALMSLMCVCEEWREGAPAAGDAGDGRAETGSDHEEGRVSARGRSWAGTEGGSTFQGTHTHTLQKL